MAGGSLEKEKPTDEQCPNCGRWYFGRGNALNMHKANCDGGSDDPDPPATESREATDADVAQAASESSTENPAMQGPPSESDSGTSGTTCPECGGSLKEPGETFTVQGEQWEMDDGEYGCLDCDLLYSEGEV